MRKLYLVCYDVVNNSKRHTVMKHIRAYAISRQKSFYECLITDNELDELRQILSLKIDRKTDKVHIFRLDPRMSTMYFGIAFSQSTEPFLVV